MPLVWWLAGTARSDRSARIDRAVLANLDRTLLIVPNRSHARQRLETLLAQSGRPGIVGSPVLNFEDFVRRLLAGTEHAHASLGGLAQRLILKQALEIARTAGALDAWGDAAQTDGFLNHLQHVIARIKQAAKPPEEFAETIGKRNRDVPIDRAVLAVYTRYHELLRKRNVVDLEGMYWLAKLACDTGEPHGLDGVDTLVFDSFDDFTPSEFNLIVAAAQRVETVAFGLNLDERPGQGDLYKVPRETLARIRQTFPGASAHTAIEEPPADCETAYVSQNLLLRDRLPPRSDLHSDVEFSRCHSRDHEMETIARRIKRLIQREGVTPGRIAVVFRRVEPVALLARDIFREFGVPVRGVQRLPLASSAFVSMVLHVVESGANWTPQFVREALIAPWFVERSTPHAATFPLLLRMAPAGKRPADWMDAANRLAQRIADARGQDVGNLLRHVPDAREAAESLVRVLQRLKSACDRIGQQAAVATSARQLADAVLDWPLDHALASVAPGDARDIETKAIHAFFATLASLEQWHDPDEPPRPRHEFAQALREAVSMASITLEQPPAGVEIVDMERARYHRYDHVFVAGLTQGEVPAAQPASAVYSEAERHEFDRLGIPFDDPQRHSLREVLLFQRMFYTARERLYLSWHEIAESGRIVGRSLYLHEVEGILERNGTDATETAGSVLLPDPGLVACERDLRNLAFAPQMDDATARGRFPEIDRVVAIEQRRYSNAEPDAHDGRLANPDNLAQIAADFGDTHRFSASELERYAKCPFLFFAERVLALFNVEETNDTLDPMTRGNILHETLREFHARFPGMAVADIMQENTDTANTAMDEALHTAFERQTVPYRHLGSGVLAGEQARLRRTLSNSAQTRTTGSPGNSNARSEKPTP